MKSENVVTKKLETSTGSPAHDQYFAVSTEINDHT